MGVIKAPTSLNYHEDEQDDSHEDITEPRALTTTSIGAGQVNERSLSRGNPMSGPLVTTFSSPWAFRSIILSGPGTAQVSLWAAGDSWS